MGGKTFAVQATDTCEKTNTYPRRLCLLVYMTEVGEVKKILLIDDEKLTLHLVQKALENGGYQVEVARDGKSGLELYRRDPADLVITDIVMPVKDGLKTILELREIDEDVPVIAISGGGAIAKERYLSIAQYLDNVRTVAKPFTMDELIEVIQELV